MVFLVASVCGFWYEGSEDNGVFGGLRNVGYHLGSITSVVILCGFVKLLHLMMVVVTKVIRVRVLMRSFCSYMKNLTIGINCYSIIILAITSKPHSQSTTILQNLLKTSIKIFKIVRSFNRILTSFTIIPTCLIPALICVSIVLDKNKQKEMGIQSLNEDGLIVGIIVMGLGLGWFWIVFGVFWQCFNCVFVLYCMDKNQGDIVGCRIQEELTEQVPKQEISQIVLKCTQNNQ